MSAVAYLHQGVGVTPSQGLAATAASLGVQSINSAAGAAYLFDAAMAQGGQAWGLQIRSSSAAVANVRMLADTGGAGVANKQFARTWGITTPDKLPLSGEAWTFSLFRYYDAAGGTRGTFLQIRLTYVSATTAKVSLFTATNNTYYDFAGSAIVTAGQKIQLKLKANTGTTTTNGTVDAQLYIGAAKVDGDTPDGTLSVANANLLQFPCEVGDLYLNGVSSGSGTVTFGSGYDLMELGRTTFIPLYAADAPALDSGTISSIDSAGNFTVPSGSVLANLSDADASTYADSSAAPATRDAVRASLPRIAPKSSLTFNIDWSVIDSGSLTVDVRLYQGTTLRGTVNVGSVTSASTLPPAVTFDSTVCGAITLDAGGKWSGLKIEIGLVVG